MADGAAADRSPAFWETVGIDYAANELTILQLCGKYEITQGQFNYAKLQLRLGPAKHAAGQPGQDHQAAVQTAGPHAGENWKTEMTTVSETEVNVLGKLVQSMGKLIEIEATTNVEATPRQTKDMHDIRRKLVERIAELKRS